MVDSLVKTIEESNNLQTSSSRSIKTHDIITGIVAQEQPKLSLALFHPNASDKGSVNPEKWVASQLSKVHDDLFTIPIAATEKLPKFRKSTSPLVKAGIDKQTFLHFGVSPELIERLYRALYVYTSGFHTLVRDVTKHCDTSAKQKHVSTNVWMSFLALLERFYDRRSDQEEEQETAEDAFPYKMQMQILRSETSKWRNTVEAERKAENSEFRESLVSLQCEIDDSHTTIAKKNRIIHAHNQVLSNIEMTLAEKETRQWLLYDRQVSLQSSVSNLSLLKSELESQVQQLQQNLSAQKILTFEANRSNRDLAALLSVKSRVVDGMKSNMTGMKESICSREKENHALRASVDKLEETLAVLKLERDDAKDEARIVSEKHIESSCEVLKQRCANTELEDTIASLESRVAELEGQVALTAQHLKEEHDVVTHLKEKEFTLSSSNSDLKTTVKSLKALVVEMEEASRADKTKEFLRAARESQESLRSEVSELSENLKQAKSAEATLQNLLAAERKVAKTERSHLQALKKSLFESERHATHTKELNESQQLKLVASQESSRKIMECFEAFKDRAAREKVAANNLILNLESEVKTVSDKVECTLNSLRESELSLKKSQATVAELRDTLETVEKKFKDKEDAFEELESVLQKLRESHSHELQGQVEKTLQLKQGLLNIYHLVKQESLDGDDDDSPPILNDTECIMTLATGAVASALSSTSKLQDAHKELQGLSKSRMETYTAKVYSIRCEAQLRFAALNKIIENKTKVNADLSKKIADLEECAAALQVLSLNQSRMMQQDLEHTLEQKNAYVVSINALKNELDSIRVKEERCDKMTLAFEYLQMRVEDFESQNGISKPELPLTEDVGTQVKSACQSVETQTTTKKSARSSFGIRRSPSDLSTSSRRALRSSMMSLFDENIIEERHSEEDDDFDGADELMQQLMMPRRPENTTRTKSLSRNTPLRRKTIEMKAQARLEKLQEEASAAEEFNTVFSLVKNQKASNNSKRTEDEEVAPIQRRRRSSLIADSFRETREAVNARRRQSCSVQSNIV